MADNKVMWRVGVDVGGTFTDLFGWNQKTNQSISYSLMADDGGL